MSEEFKLDDEEDAPTIELEKSDDDQGGDEGATIALGDDAGADDEQSNLDLSDEEPNGGDEDEDDGGVQSARPALPVSEGPGIGAFTAMLILSFLLYATAAAVVVYQISEYAQPGTFSWEAPMP